MCARNAQAALSSVTDEARQFSRELAEYSKVRVPEIEASGSSDEYRIELQLLDAAATEAGLQGTYVSTKIRYSALSDYKSKMLSKKGHKSFFKSVSLPKFPGKTLTSVKVGSKAATQRQEALEHYFQALLVHPEFIGCAPSSEFEGRIPYTIFLPEFFGAAEFGNCRQLVPKSMQSVIHRQPRQYKIVLANREGAPPLLGLIMNPQQRVVGHVDLTAAGNVSFSSAHKLWHEPARNPPRCLTV